MLQPIVVDGQAWMESQVSWKKSRSGSNSQRLPLPAVRAISDADGDAWKEAEENRQECETRMATEFGFSCALWCKEC